MAEPAKPKLLGGTAIKPPERHGWEKISYLIYDKDTGEILTRTPKSWALIFIFYVIYYSLLACFWYGMLQLFFLTVPTDNPKYQQDDSIIGSNPGVGIRPGQADEKLDSSMIFLAKGGQDTKPTDDKGEGPKNADWAKRYEIFLDKYKDKDGTTTDCSKIDKENPKEACLFDPNAVLGDCAKDSYGYLKSPPEPCVLLKINRIFGWQPQEYSDDDLVEAQKENEDYPEDKMPTEVANKIKKDKTKIYIDCQGENPFDREQLKGKMSYFPTDQGISFDYFPYEHANRNYHNPLVAVQFKGLEVGVLYHIQCKLWSKEVRHSKKERAGLVHFEIFLDDEIRI